MTEHFIKLSDSIMQIKGLNLAERVVLAFIRSEIDVFHRNVMSAKDISDALNIPVVTVKRITKNLSVKNFVTRTREPATHEAYTYTVKGENCSVQNDTSQSIKMIPVWYQNDTKDGIKMILSSLYKILKDKGEAPLNSHYVFDETKEHNYTTMRSTIMQAITAGEMDNICLVNELMDSIGVRLEKIKESAVAPLADEHDSCDSITVKEE